MDLWIRSKDKQTLIKIDRVDVDGNSIIVWQNNYNCDEIYLGSYKTKERALEVLDEIQDLIKPKLLLKGYDNLPSGFEEKAIIQPTHVEVKQLNTYVYEMPKE